MMEEKPARPRSNRVRGFDVQGFFDSAGTAKTIVECGPGETVFREGDLCEHVMYIQAGAIKLSVVSKTGREAVVAVLGPSDFFGEECLAGQARRSGKATALVPSVILLVRKAMMIRLLHERRAMSDRFIAHMLARNIRTQADLTDQVFDSSEKRVARALLLLAGYGTPDPPARVLPNISQDTLATMAGMTRTRVSFFLKRFKKLGFIEYNGDVAINSALLSFVLQD